MLIKLLKISWKRKRMSANPNMQSNKGTSVSPNREQSVFMRKSLYEASLFNKLALFLQDTGSKSHFAVLTHTLMFSLMSAYSKEACGHLKYFKMWQTMVRNVFLRCLLHFETWKLACFSQAGSECLQRVVMKTVIHTVIIYNMLQFCEE